MELALARQAAADVAALHERRETLADEAESLAFAIFLRWNATVRAGRDGARLLRLSHRAERRRERREDALGLPLVPPAERDADTARRLRRGEG